MNIGKHEEKAASYYPVYQSQPLQTAETVPAHTEAALQERVTPQEFAQALASLEARKENAEHALQETVPIGEALQQLSISADAAEILAEVQQERQRQARKQQALKRTLVQRRRLGLGLGGALVLSLGILMMSSFRSTPLEVAAPATVVSPQPVSAEIRTLAEVSEGQLVQTNPQDFKALLQNPALSPASVIVQTLGNSPVMGSWTLVKHDGHIYMRGYMAAMSAQAMAQMKSLQVFSMPYDSSQVNGMAYVKPVTMRLGSFSWQGMSSEAGIPALTVSKLHLDHYGNEHPNL